MMRHVYGYDPIHRLSAVLLFSTLQIMGVVDVKHTQEHELTIEWDTSASNDMIADSVLALVTGIDKSPASVKRASLFY
jgi:hypothetical protein